MSPWIVEGHVNRSWNMKRLTTLERECEQNISSTVAAGLLIERLIATLEMHDSGGRCSIDPGDIMGQSRENSNG